MRDDLDEEVVGRADESPLLEVPNIDLSRIESPGPFFDPSTGSAGNSATSTTPAHSTPRRGVLSNFFGGLGLNWLRR
jgi:hypothetical protein